MFKHGRTKSEVIMDSIMRVGLTVLSRSSVYKRTAYFLRANLLLDLAADSTENSKARKVRKATKLFDLAASIKTPDPFKTDQSVSVDPKVFGSIAQLFGDRGDFERSAKARRFEVDAYRPRCNPLEVDISVSYYKGPNTLVREQLKLTSDKLQHLVTACTNGAAMSRKTGDGSGVAYFLGIEADASAMRSLVEQQMKRVANFHK